MLVGNLKVNNNIEYYMFSELILYSKSDYQLLF